MELDETIWKVVKKLEGIFKKKEIFWILSGDVSLRIQGADVEAKDTICILTSQEGASEIEKELKEYEEEKLEYVTDKEYRSFLGVYNIEGIKVKVMGDMQYKMKNGRWSKYNQENPSFFVKYKSTKIPVLTLQQEIQEYYQLDKFDKVEKIAEVLSKNEYGNNKVEK